ncbi:hypothetical protein KUTeg_007604 [Tegillarca granosa]|uniref:Uncharacterized protein n=1 Tax=Tegillarca granosa TaxID=220873 RepID=A0ABQ9FDS8_TEGGR|nr:hypothetical protein KUTeg_007604 [Tegillarca granosa]
MKKKGKERKHYWTELRNLSNFHHNLKVLNDKNGVLIVDRRPASDKNYESFLTCPYCLGFFFSDEMWHHAKVCPYLDKKDLN